MGKLRLPYYITLLQVSKKRNGRPWRVDRFVVTGKLRLP